MSWSDNPIPAPVHSHPPPDFHPQHQRPHPSNLHHQHTPYSRGTPSPWLNHAPAFPELTAGDDPWGVDARGRSIDDQASQPKHHLSSIQVSNTNDSRHPHYLPPQGFSPPSKVTMITQAPFNPRSTPRSHSGQGVGYSSPESLPPSNGGHHRRNSRPNGQYRPPPPFVPQQQNGNVGQGPPHPMPLVHAQAALFNPQSVSIQQPNQHRSPPPAPLRQCPRGRPNKTSLENSIVPAVNRQWGNGNEAAAEVSSTVAVPATPPNHTSQTSHWDDNWEVTPRQSQATADTTDSSPWNPKKNVSKWVEKVEPSSPPIVSSARATPPSFSPPRAQQPSEAPASPQASDDGLERPSSAQADVPPTTVYISDDESVASTKLPTPHLTTAAIDRVQAQVRAAMSEDVSRPPRTRAPQVLEVSVDSEAGAVPYQAPVEDDVDSANSGRRQRIKHEPGRPFFKPPISAIYSPQWADRRLLVELPLRMKTDIVLDALQKNFSRYGTVKYTFHHERNGDSCEKGFVIFAEAESLYKCLEDPFSRDLSIPSLYTRSVDTFKVVLKHLPPEAMTKSIFIQVTGARFDDSPVVQAACFGVLPAKITIVAVSRYHRPSGQTRTTARILEQGQVPRDLVEELRLTRKDVKAIDEIYLGRGVAEKDFIPRLCDYFGEVCWSPIPPSNKGQGWIVIMGGPNDAMKVMDELGRVPGILARWAQPGEGGCTAPSELQHGIQESPLGTLERYLHQSVQRNPYTGRVPQAGAFDPQMNAAPGPLPELVAQVGAGYQQVPALLLPPIAIAPPAPPPQRDLAGSEHGSHHSSDGYRHLLQHSLVPTYRGRILEQVTIEGEVRFIDRAAVFVGRLSKVNENLQTLFQRFSKYGPIFAIEYNQNQKYTETTYAIARVLFHTEDAARRAIQYENGAISFGSGIKVEERRVLPTDVETKEMYFDPLNHPVEPWNKGQYSPNSHLREAHPYISSFVPPPPPPENVNAIGGPTYHPGFQPKPQVAFGYGPPPAFWHVGPDGVQVQDGSTLPPTPPQQGDGQLPNGVYTSGPNPGEMVPMIQCMGQNYYPYPVPNGVYTPDMFFTGPFAPPPPPSIPPQAFSPPQSPIESTAQTPNQPTVITAEPEQISQVPSASSSGHTTHSPIRIKEFVMKNGNYTPVYDPDDLKRYQLERGLPEPKFYVPVIEGEIVKGSPEASSETIKATSIRGGEAVEPVYATIAVPSTNGDALIPAQDAGSEQTGTLNPYIDAHSDRSVPLSHPKQRIRTTHSSRDIRSQKSGHALPARPPASSQGSNRSEARMTYQRKNGNWSRKYGTTSSPPAVSTPAVPETPAEESAPENVDDGGW